MKLLADAHIGHSIVAHLKSLGHDVLHAEILEPRLPDSRILHLAAEQQRVVLTADKDFGELIFRSFLPSAGVILLRLAVASEIERLDLFKQFWPLIERNVPGHFVVVTNRSIRRRPLPTS